MNALEPMDGRFDAPTPPSNLEAEQALLGAILVNNRAAEKVVDFLRPEHFMQPGHGRVYAAVLTLIERGRIADPVTLKEYFETDEAFSEVGGASYIARLAGAAVTVINAQNYGRVIFDLALRRGLIEIGEELSAMARTADLETKPADLIDQAQESLFGLSSAGITGKERSFGETLRAALDQIARATQGKVPKVTTGLEPLDRALAGGMASGHLILLAGRPGMGKTALALQIAMAAAQKALDGDRLRGAPVAFFSLEMEAEELAARQLSADAQVDADAMARGDITAEQYSALEMAGRKIWEMPIHIRDTASLTSQQIRMQTIALKRQYDIGLVVVDHLGRVRRAGREPPHIEIQLIAQDLKNLAKDLKVPVLALSQLNRGVENRDDKRPNLSDLRQSGALEEEADIVAFVYRDEYYASRSEPQEDTPDHERWFTRMETVKGLGEVIIAKHRGGRTGTTKLGWDGPHTRFHDLRDIPAPQHQAGLDF